MSSCTDAKIKSKVGFKWIEKAKKWMGAAACGYRIFLAVAVGKTDWRIYVSVVSGIVHSTDDSAVITGTERIRLWKYECLLLFKAGQAGVTVNINEL